MKGSDEVTHDSAEEGEQCGGARLDRGREVVPDLAEGSSVKAPDLWAEGGATEKAMAAARIEKVIRAPGTGRRRWRRVAQRESGSMDGGRMGRE
jgi:hypothetical protein